jgi:hypothetical protein
VPQWAIESNPRAPAGAGDVLHWAIRDNQLQLWCEVVGQLESPASSPDVAGVVVWFLYAPGLVVNCEILVLVKLSETREFRFRFLPDFRNSGQWRPLWTEKYNFD